MNTVNLLVELHLKDSEAKPFAEMFRREFISRSRTESGCQLYDLWVDSKDATRMTIVERWESQAALDVHMAQDWFKIWAPKMEAALQEPLVVRFLRTA